MTNAELIGRLESGEGGDRKLDALILAAVAAPVEAHRWQITTSLDDAMRLVEKTLPGWWWTLDNTHPDFWTKGWSYPWGADLRGPITWSAFDGCPEPVFESYRSDNAPSAPRALLIALLRALEDQQK